MHIGQLARGDALIIRFDRQLVVKSRVVVLMIALALIAGFVSLGRWQLQRAGEKQRMLDAVASALENKHAQPLAATEDDDPSMYQWASGRGRFRAAPILLLDNQRRGDQVGVNVFGVFQPDHGRALLIGLGWLPVPGDRRLPDLSLPGGEQTVVGLLTPPPSPGIALGAAYVDPDAQQRPGGTMTSGGQRWLLTRVDIAALSAGLHVKLAARVLRLDPALPIGYARDLDVLPNTLLPERHRGYAVQWFGLALLTAILALYLGFRRRPT